METFCFFTVSLIRLTHTHKRTLKELVVLPDWLPVQFPIIPYHTMNNILSLSGQIILECPKRIDTNAAATSSGGIKPEKNKKNGE